MPERSEESMLVRSVSISAEIKCAKELAKMADLRSVASRYCKSSERLLRRLTKYESSEKAFGESVSEQRELEKNLRSLVLGDFRRYMEQHPEVPGEEHITVQIRNKDRYTVKTERASPGVYKCYNEAEAIRIPFNPKNLFALVILGEGPEPDMHDVIGLSVGPPLNVTSKFENFVKQEMPLNVRVLKYFSWSHMGSDKSVSFYGFKLPWDIPKEYQTDWLDNPLE